MNVVYANDMHAFVGVVALIHEEDESDSNFYKIMTLLLLYDV